MYSICIYAVRGTGRCLVYFSNLLPFFFLDCRTSCPVQGYSTSQAAEDDSRALLFSVTRSKVIPADWKTSLFLKHLWTWKWWNSFWFWRSVFPVDSVSWLFFMSSIRTVSVSLFCLSVEIPRVGSQEWFYGNTAFPVLFLFKVLKENTWIKDLDFFWFFFSIIFEKNKSGPVIFLYLQKKKKYYVLMFWLQLDIFDSTDIVFKFYGVIITKIYLMFVWLLSQSTNLLFRKISDGKKYLLL